jgi:hypothetical protein
MKKTEVAWAAGFFEGDGSIYVYRSHRNPKGYIRLSVTQVTTERLERFEAAMGVGSVVGPYHHKGTTKWMWRVAAKKDVRHSLNLMWPYLGPTMRRRLRDCLDLL